MARSKFLIPILILLGLAACAGSIPFQVQEVNSIKFSSSEPIHIESAAEIVKLSSRLGNELIRAGFNIADSRKNAAYILTFDYDAQFDVYPWVIKSFTITMTGSRSGDVIYKITSAKPGSEPVDSLIKRIADDMSVKLLTNSMRGHVAIINSGEDK
jgi:hypothetical protein